MKERHEVEAWTHQLQQAALEYMAQGMSAEDAEQKAADDICRDIRNSKPIGR